MRHYITLLLLALVALAANAQDNKITGTVTDHDSKEALEQVTIQLLKTDSSYVAGTLTNEKGEFALTTPAKGKYMLRLSSVGYKTVIRHISVDEGKPLVVGNVAMTADAVMLKGAAVTGQARKVVVKEDTFIYNSSAYRTPEGSVVEELVKRLPGAKIDDDGKITINGKEVKKIKVDGKEFMTGDTKVAMKNLPTSIVEKVKAYDEKSDLSRVTGIDDGNESAVLDFGLKPGMNHGMFANADVSVGTKDRYAERLMAAVMRDKVRMMTFGNANNTGDMGFPGGGGFGRFGRGRSGLNASKMWAANFNYDNKKTFQLDGNVRWNHSDGDAWSQSSMENFVSKNGAFSNSVNQNYSRSNSWNSELRLEWKPDTLTNIMFRPTFGYSTSDGKSGSTSATYNDDPYSYSSDPLSASAMAGMAAQGVMVNSSRSRSLSYSENKQMGGSLQLNRRLSSMGRNVTLRLEGNYSEGNSDNLSLNNVHLYQVKDALGNDSTYQTNRYNVTPTKNWSYGVQTTYSEPLWKATFLQFSYKFNYSYSRSDRATYDFSNLGEDFFDGVSNTYRNWESYLTRLDRPYTDYLDESLSRYSEYRNYTHETELMFRMIRDKYNFNVGVMLQPQKSHFIQDYHGVHSDTTRNVVNFTPTLDFRYRFSKVSNLRISYRGSTSQPSMSDLLDITDDSDPLNIRKGNPGLKPAFTSNLMLNYRNFIEHRSQSMAAFLRFSTTRNSVGSAVTYDENTGGRITQPRNINGNWNVNGMFMYNTSIDTLGVWNVNTSTDYSYQNMVGYVTPDRNSGVQKNTTKSLSVGERLETSYRNSWLEVALDGSFNYTHSRNKLQSQANLDTWRFAYGGTVTLNTPWGMSLSTNLHENSRRGFSDSSMNTDELVWNAQLSQSFLKGKPLTVMLQFYDILDNQSNFSRTINAMQRSDTEFNSINSYAMLHVVYRFNMFGGKISRGGNGPDGPGGRPGRGGRFGGPGMPPGGGGMRPPRF